MTAQPAEQTARSRWPEKTLADVVHILTGDVDRDVRREFEELLRSAGEEAKATNSFEPMNALVERCWPTAVFWADPVEARRVLAESDEFVRRGPGDRPRRPFSRERFVREWEAHHGQKLNT